MQENSSASFAKIKALLDKVQLEAERKGDGQFASLIKKNLLAAESSLVAARKKDAQGDNAASESKCRMASYYIELAMQHINSVDDGQREPFSDRPQEYIKTLIKGIIEFKSLVEWRNCELRPTLKSWFIEIADLCEDALNQLRFNKPKEAERSAVAALLLQEHLCRAAQYEHVGQISLIGPCAGTKLPSESRPLREACEGLHKARNKIAQHQHYHDHKTQEQLENAFDAGELALVESILAFADSKKDQKDKIFTVHYHISTIDRIVIQSTENQQVLHGETDEEEATKKNRAASRSEEFSRAKRAAKAIVAPNSFEQEVKTFHQLLKERVDDPELLALRVLALVRLYRELYKAYESNQYSKAIVLAVTARVDLEKLNLLLSQAELFTGDKNT